MKTLRTHRKIFKIDKDGLSDIKIYFRVPLTAYFVGRVKEDTNVGWSRLLLFRKGFNNGYYWEVV